MRRFARSDAYVRIRLVNGLIFMILGVLVGVRGAVAAGPPGAKITVFVLAAAMIALGFFRLRVYFEARAAK